MRARVGPACLAMLPLAVWPGLHRPFSIPKLLWMATLALVLLASSVRVPWATVSAQLRWTAGAWIASFAIAAVASDLPALPALVIGLAAPLLALGLVRSGADPLAIVTAQAAGATACALVALLQWAGADPFTVLGWQPPIEGASVRMRVYGTLGNPNFVGVLMAMSLPLTVAAHRAAAGRGWRRLAELALVVQAMAIVATGSRGAVLGLAAAMVTYALLRWSRRVRIGMGALLVFGIIAVVVSPARPLDTTAAGRVHLWRIAAPHALDAPVTGQGPGAVTLRFPAWQRHAARAGIRDPRFAGLTDHVHNDYLEALVERGVPGVVSLVLPLILLIAAGARLPRPTAPLVAGACAAVTAGAACAIVDFPLARPTELAWWWVSIAIAFEAARRARAEAGDGGEDGAHG